MLCGLCRGEERKCIKNALRTLDEKRILKMLQEYSIGARTMEG